VKRGDVDEIEGRVARPIDDGYLSDKHAAVAVKRPTFNGAGRLSRRKPLRASASNPVTQLWYARQGIVTPEMEFIAIRENGGEIENRESDKTIHVSQIPNHAKHLYSNIPALFSGHSATGLEKHQNKFGMVRWLPAEPADQDANSKFVHPESLRQS
jgi:phosphomethylpyrimidine synthase